MAFGVDGVRLDLEPRFAADLDVLVVGLADVVEEPHDCIGVGEVGADQMDDVIVAGRLDGQVVVGQLPSAASELDDVGGEDQRTGPVGDPNVHRIEANAVRGPRIDRLAGEDHRVALVGGPRPAPQR